MIDVKNQWNPKQALLKDIILKEGRFEEAVELTLDMHSLVHSSEMLNTYLNTFEDELWDGLDEKAFSTMININETTIAWNIWHLTRIEDITANILIAEDTQVINCDNWLQKMNVKVTDTGNAMNAEEINALSKDIVMKELRNYRIAVGRKTREIIKQLKPKDMKRKMNPDALRRIVSEGGVLEHEGSKWLIDFWGKKNVAGIILMPITRHQVVHLNDSIRIKEKLMKQTKKHAK